MFGVVIVGEQLHRSILLAEQIERHVPGVKICGIICRLPYRSPITLQSRVRSAFGAVAGLVSGLLLHSIHGGRLKARDKERSSGTSDARCRQAGWALHFTHKIESDETKAFLRGTKATLTVLAGLPELPARETLTTDGLIGGRLCSIGNQQISTSALGKSLQSVDGIEITVMEWSAHGERPLARFELYPEPLDTSVSLELKSNLILRDLLVQSVAALVQQQQDAAAQVQRWARSMIPSFLWRTDRSKCHMSIDQAPPLRVRAPWKLCLYSFLLLSPSVVFRNWLYRRRKQCPLLFLTSHLISDRHHRMALPTEAFFDVVGYLKKFYRIVSFSEACRLLKAGKNDQPTLALTFDDGYEDNFVNLRAVCEEMEIPVTLFVATDPVTFHREFAHDFRRGLLGFRALTWEQIRYWSAGDAEFHSHTCSHYDCGSTDEALLTRELIESKRVLEEQLGKPVTAFAFPFGKLNNMSNPAVAIAGRIYDHFLSSFGGENIPSASDDHKHLRRKHLQGNTWESELDIQNVFAVATSVKRLLRVSLNGSSIQRPDLSLR
jgi:peptidoglycan/xylan/chitin deacetylase (PgdA/CDA1 family)